MVIRKLPRAKSIVGNNQINLPQNYLLPHSKGMYRKHLFSIVTESKSIGTNSKVNEGAHRFFAKNLTN